MKSVQESKNELEAAVRYAENAISSAKQTIESMEFRQEMAKKQSSEQTGRGAALNDRLMIATKEVEEQKSEIEVLERQLNEAAATVQFHIDREAGFLDQIKELNEEVNKLRGEKEASSGPCGCQAYRDLEEARGRAEGEVELLQRTISDLDTEVKALKEANMSLVCDNDDLKDDLKGQRDFLCECFKEFTEKLGTIGFEGA